MDAREIESDLSEVLVTEAQIHGKLAELARRIEAELTQARNLADAAG